MSLLAEERRFRIREVLSRERTVTASELIRTLGVTAATVRRDLAALEKEGVLVRSHGGAVSRTSSTKFPTVVRSRRPQQSRRKTGDCSRSGAA